MDDFIYMNNAATSWPKPPDVADAVSRCLTDLPGSANRGGIEHFNVFCEVRNKLSLSLGVKAKEHIALGSNATWALNLALFGYPFKRGDNVLTSKSEHNSVLRPLYELKRRGLINVTYLDTDKTGRISPDLWKAALKSLEPRLAVFTHASNITGAVNDAHTLSQLAKDSGADVLMDASQTLGFLGMEADGAGIDMVAFTGHKYLLGPQGTGGLYVRPGLDLHPLLIGGTGSNSDLETMPEEMPSHLEAGTGNEPSFHGLLAALLWAEQNPLNIQEQNEKLNLLRNGLSGAGAEVIVPDGACTPVISFTIPGKSPQEVGFILEESYDIICRTGLHCAPKLFDCLGQSGGTIRLSLSRFTTIDEINFVIDAIKDIADEV